MKIFGHDGTEAGNAKYGTIKNASNYKVGEEVRVQVTRGTWIRAVVTEVDGDHYVVKTLEDWKSSGKQPSISSGQEIGAPSMDMRKNGDQL